MLESALPSSIFGRNALVAIAVLASMSLTACDSAGPSGAEGSAPVTLSVTSAELSAGQATAAKSRTFTDDAGNELTIDAAEIVLREIKFERDEAVENCSASSNDDSDSSGDDNSSNGDDDASSDDDGCEEVERGPFLVDVPLTSDDPTAIIEEQLPVGRWEEVEFKVHKLDDDDADDRALLEDTGFPEDISIRVTGTWTPANGSSVPFTYTSDLNEDQEIELNPPLEVTADAATNVTFRLALSTWFRTASGEFVNPERGNRDGDLEDLIEENIERSIEAFEDDDRDGREDDDDSDDDDSEGDDSDDDDNSDDDDSNGS